MCENTIGKIRMDEIIYLCMSYFEVKGATFKSNRGKAVSVEFEDSNEWYWYSDYPYKLYHPQKWRNLDKFKEITNKGGFTVILQRLHACTHFLYSANLINFLNTKSANVPVWH